jgi:hypothetical protein
VVGGLRLLGRIEQTVQVPFADVAGVIPGVAEDFREGEAHHAGEAGTDEAAAAHCESAVKT